MTEQTTCKKCKNQANIILDDKQTPTDYYYCDYCKKTYNTKPKVRKPYHLPTTITEAELKKVIDSIPKSKSNRDQKVLAYCLGFYECMRISEVISLQEKDVDTSQRLLRIREAKGKKDRNIPIAPEVLKGLKHLPFKFGIRALQRHWNIDSKKGLGKRINFHALRHSGASHYLNVKKWDLRSVQVFLGHSRINTTEIYTHVNPTNLVDRMWS